MNAVQLCFVIAIVVLVMDIFLAYAVEAYSRWRVQNVALVFGFLALLFWYGGK